MNANTSDCSRWTRRAVSSIGAIVCAVALASCGGDSDSSTGGISGDPLSLAWDPPNSNVDGSGVNDLAGYRVYDGPAPGDYDMVTDVGVDPEVTLDLDPGTYYIAVAAVDSAGNESTLSPELVATLP